jgi:predicted DNA-binding transcriptional regulator AlpA
MPIGIERMLTTDELAELCRTAPSTVRYWRHIGAGPRGVRIGRCVLYRESQVLSWLREREQQER